MLVDAFVVYDTVSTNWKGFFKMEGDANNYASPNGWTVKPYKISDTFYLTVVIE